MDRRQLARRLQASCGLTGHFVLRSGEVSDFYFDKYLFEAVPELLDAVAELASPLVPDGTEILAGLELGGVPISTALSLRTGIPQVLVRKEAKTYGTAKLAEGLSNIGPAADSGRRCDHHRGPGRAVYE